MSSRRSSSNAQLPPLLAHTPADYSGAGGLLTGGGNGVGTSGKRGSGNFGKRASGSFTTPTALIPPPQRVALSAHIPLPSDPDPDLMDSPTEEQQGASVLSLPYRNGQGSSPQSSGARHSFNTLPTHSRSSGGGGGSPIAGMRSPIRSHQRMPSVSHTMPPSQHSHPPPAKTSLTAITPNTSPLLRSTALDTSSPSRGDTHVLSFPYSADASSTIVAVAATPASARATAAGRATDPLLSTAAGGQTSRESSALWHACRSLLILLCCFMTPSRYDALANAARARQQLRIDEASAAGVRSTFASYASATRTNRNLARDRHLRRQSNLVAEAAEQHARLTAAAGDETGDGQGAADPSAAAAAATRLALAQQAQQRTELLLREGGDSDDEEQELARDLAERRAEEVDRLKAQRRGDCCERPCFPRACDEACCPCYVQCCTVRRSVCISVYTILLVALSLFLAFYFAYVRRHGWRWPKEWAAAAADEDDEFY